MIRVVWIAAIVVFVLAAVVWLGFRVPTQPFDLGGAATADPDRRPIPDDLPTPVDRYLRAVSIDGETLPEIRAARYTGTGWAKPFGVWLPIRHQATVVPGETMFRVMEFPWYGATLLHVEDTYLRGEGKTVISGLIDGETTGPHTDQGAFLALAAESVMMPSAESLDACWEAVDAHHARLLFPYGETTEQLLVSFDPATGLPERIEAQRYKSEGGDKVGWWIELMDYRPMGGLLIPARFEVTWADESGPWSRWTIDEVIVESDAPPVSGFGSRTARPIRDSTPHSHHDRS